MEDIVSRQELDVKEHYLSEWDDQMETRLKNSCSYQFTHD